MKVYQPLQGYTCVHGRKVRPSKFKRRYLQFRWCLKYVTTLHYRTPLLLSIPTTLHQFTQIKSRLQLLQYEQDHEQGLASLFKNTLYQDLYYWEQGSAETIRKSTSAKQQNGYQLSNEVLVITVGKLRCRRMASVQKHLHFWREHYSVSFLK